MWTFLRRQVRIFMIGFIVASIVTLFIVAERNEILWTVIVGAAGGAGLVVVLYFLERRFPDESNQKPL